MSGDVLTTLLGPRVDAATAAERRLTFLLPTLGLAAACVMLLASVFLPYWRLTLLAPQYPQGLHVEAYLSHVAGDVSEIDGLNHYIGMRPLAEAAQLERSLSIGAVTVFALLVAAAIWVHNRWAALLALPALLFPAVFLADMYYWLHRFGTELDPTAPLSSSIEPFVPPVLGRGQIGQFATVATPGPGLLLATAASLAILLALWLHRRAYKPLLEAAPQ
jgi:copper chaperone NosL